MSKKQMANKTKMTAEMLFDSLIWFGNQIFDDDNYHIRRNLEVESFLLIDLNYINIKLNN